MTITKPDPKEVERRAEEMYRDDSHHWGTDITWARRCETVRDAYRNAAIKRIAQESVL